MATISTLPQTKIDLKPDMLIECQDKNIRTQAKFATLNKNNTIEEYIKECDPLTDGLLNSSRSYYIEDVLITHVMVFTKLHIRFFSQRLLEPFEWLEGLGGSGTDWEPGKNLEDMEFFQLSDEELQKTSATIKS